MGRLYVAVRLLDADPVPPIRGPDAEAYGWADPQVAYADRLGGPATPAAPLVEVRGASRASKPAPAGPPTAGTTDRPQLRAALVQAEHGCGHRDPHGSPARPGAVGG